MSIIKKRNSAIGFLLLLFIFIYVFLAGLKGIDFGTHSDESKIIESVESSLEDEILLPRWYHYPSVCYNIALLSIMPDLFTMSFNKTKEITLKLRKLVGSHSFKMRLRTIFLFITLISAVWIFLLVLIWRRSNIEAFVSATLLLSLWELHYHARWIAPDGIMMGFGILSMLLMYLAINSDKYNLFFLRSAAIVVGLTCGVKYPGGIFILPLIYTVYLIKKKGQDIRNAFWNYEYLIVILIFIASFIISTPGSLIQPYRFILHITHEMNHYKTGHGGYTVNSIIHHSWLILNYFMFVAFSKYWPIAIIFFIFMCFGIYHLVCKEKKLSIWFLMVPCLYVLYFASQKVMIVRNLLVILPFLAILASIGLCRLTQLIPSIFFRRLFLVGICFMLLINFMWIYEASESIAYKDSIIHSENITAYLKNKPNTRYYISEVARAYLNNKDIERYNLLNIVNNSEEADLIIFSSSEVKPLTKWIANKWGRYKIVSGMYEVNWDYHPSLFGNVHIIAVNKSTAKQLDILRPNDLMAEKVGMYK